MCFAGVQNNFRVHFFFPNAQIESTTSLNPKTWEIESNKGIMFFCFRGDIRLGEKGAEAWEPHWDAQQGGGPEWGRPVLHGYLISMWLCCCHFYIKFLVPQVCFKSQTLSVPFLCLKFFLTCFSLLQLVSWHSFWTLIPVHPKRSLSWYIIIYGFDGQVYFYTEEMH